MLPNCASFPLALAERRLPESWWAGTQPQGGPPLACMAVGAALVASADAFFFALPALVESGGLTDVVGTWFASGNLRVDLALRMDALSGLMCLVVHLRGHAHPHLFDRLHGHDEDYARFFAYLNLFCGAMLLLVLGDSCRWCSSVGRAWACAATCSSVLVRRDGQCQRGQEGVHHQPRGRPGFPHRHVLAFPRHRHARHSRRSG